MSWWYSCSFWDPRRSVPHWYDRRSLGTPSGGDVRWWDPMMGSHAMMGMMGSIALESAVHFPSRVMRDVGGWDVGGWDVGRWDVRGWGMARQGDGTIHDAPLPPDLPPCKSTTSKSWSIWSTELPPAHLSCFMLIWKKKRTMFKWRSCHTSCHKSGQVSSLSTWIFFQ